MLSYTARILLAATLGLGSLAHAQVNVQNAWARATSAQQHATGAFMQLTAEHDVRLVGISSPVAGIVEVHEMKMEGNVMKMRALPGLDLPAGKTIELKPGGLHIMLQDLHQPLPNDSHITLALELQDKSGKRQTQQLQIPVRSMGGGMPADHGMPHKNH